MFGGFGYAIPQFGEPLPIITRPWWIDNFDDWVSDILQDWYDVAAPNWYVESPVDWKNSTIQVGIRMRAAATWSAGSYPTEFDFTTTPIGSIFSFVRAVIGPDGRFGIGNMTTADTAGQLDVRQQSSAGAIPVLRLEQDDVSEEFLRLIGQSTTDASQSLVDAADMPTPGTIVGWFKVYIEDEQATNPIPDGVYYVPFYSAPTV